MLAGKRGGDRREFEKGSEEMTTEVCVPKLGMTQGDINIVGLKLTDGSAVEKGEVVAIIETAKVTYEIEAPASGLIYYLRKVKDKVRIGDALAVIADSREEFESYKGRVPHKEEMPSIAFGEPEEEGIKLFFEEEEGEKKEKPPPPVPVMDVGDRKVAQRIPFIGMRRTIADNLHYSLHAGAQLTIVSETDMTELARYREQLILDHPDTRITFVDILVKILAFALKEFPIINSSIVGDEIICWGEYNIGVAVALDQGLVVPVVRDADKKSLVAVSREIKKLSDRARRNQLEPSHYQGGTFTLSSGGKVETDIITPIIKPPENAIMAVGKIGPRPAVHGGALAVRTMTFLCLTHDHRAIDGVPASLFLGRVKEIVEHREAFERVLK
jgi:pyruvate/2-oxoglutarate dehydrogenase complex dihydrolipoamide acyltransferase (E2) component